MVKIGYTDKTSSYHAAVILGDASQWNFQLKAEKRVVLQLAKWEMGNGKQHENIIVYLPSVGG